MHIVHLETGRHLYGGARQVLLLMAGLADAGIRNTLVCPPDSAIATAADPAHVDVHCIPMAGELDARFGRQLGRWLPEVNADLLHVHSRRGADVWGGLAARRARLPAVLTRRVDNPEIPVLGRIKYSMYTRVVAISEQVKRQLVADGVAPDLIEVVYSAIDANSCVATWSREQFLRCFDLSAEHLAVICAAQLIPRKGHEGLFNAWAEVSRVCPAARLLLFGQGEHEPELRALVDRLAISGTVQFAGLRADLREFLGCADVLVHPATQEGLGVILLEAQAAGLPIVAVEVGGISEAVAVDASALLVPPGDQAAFAAALTHLLDDPKLRGSLGAAGAERVRQKFAPDAMVNGNLAVYRELLK